MLDETKLSKTTNKAMDVLLSAFQKKNPTKEDLNLVRTASSVLSGSIRYEATKNSRMSLQFRVASAVLKDEGERKAYLAVAYPDLKLLGDKTTPATRNQTEQT